MSINLLIVDDHEVVLDSYGSLLESANFNILGFSKNSQDAFEKYKQYMPDVTIMDISMPGESGLMCIERIIGFDHKAKIITCTMYNEIQIIANAFRNGARGFITKSDPLDKLIDAIYKVKEGEYYLDNKYAQAIAMMDILNKNSSKDKSDINYLTELSTKEFEIFKMVAEGLNSKEIAKNLSLSPKTIANYRNQILSKLGVKNSWELTVLALKNGIIQ